MTGRAETGREARGRRTGLVWGPIVRRAWPRLALAGACCALMVALLEGCGFPLLFPGRPLVSTKTNAGLVEAYDTDGDKQADYFTTRDAFGRKVRIAYDTTHSGEADLVVNLDEVPAAEVRHVVLILDGIGYDTVEAYRREGRLRLFYPPARVISTFPPMTDLALADVFRRPPTRGLESLHFDHAANRLVGGDADYLSLKNESWARHVDYRASTLTDPFAYLYPNPTFNKELADFMKLFDRRDRPRLVAYFVSTAGLGTREALEGQHKVLDALDRLAEELIWKTRGMVKITVFSDHGHTLVRGERIDCPAFLGKRGWRITDRLERPRDVACIEYGLITYASFATRERAALAADLLQHPGVDLVTYAEGEAVVVEKPGGKAFVERRGSRYRYRTEQGDPLELLPLIATARAGAATGAALFDADGYAEDRAWLRMTLTHKYPDPLDRLWRVFHGQTAHMPDVIASLRDGYYTGSVSRSVWLPYVASTHGDLERKSSTAFIMSTAMPIATRWPPLRHRDLPEVLETLTGRPWPPPSVGSGQ